MTKEQRQTCTKFLEK